MKPGLVKRGGYQDRADITQAHFARAMRRPSVAMRSTPPQSQPLALPEHPQVVDRPLLASHRRVANLDPLGAGAATVDHRMSHTRCPAPLTLVTRVDVGPRLELDQQDRRFVGR